MNPVFVYSFDRETFSGRFATRREAINAALAAAAADANQISTIYVGQQVTPNPRAFGHARTIVDTMSRRVRDDAGEAGEKFLRKVPEKLVNELDSALEQTITAWLEFHNLMPAAKVESISEHAVPLPASVRSYGSASEVHDLGDDAVM